MKQSHDIISTVIKKRDRANQVQGEESEAEQHTLRPHAHFPLGTSSALHLLRCYDLLTFTHPHSTETHEAESSLGTASIAHSISHRRRGRGGYGRLLSNTRAVRMTGALHSYTAAASHPELRRHWRLMAAGERGPHFFDGVAPGKFAHSLYVPTSMSI